MISKIMTILILVLVVEGIKKLIFREFDGILGIYIILTILNIIKACFSIETYVSLPAYIITIVVLALIDHINHSPESEDLKND